MSHINPGNKPYLQRIQYLINWYKQGKYDCEPNVKKLVKNFVHDYNIALMEEDTYTQQLLEFQLIIGGTYISTLSDIALDISRPKTDIEIKYEFISNIFVLSLKN